MDHFDLKTFILVFCFVISIIFINRQSETWTVYIYLHTEIQLTAQSIDQ